MKKIIERLTIVCFLLVTTMVVQAQNYTIVLNNPALGTGDGISWSYTPGTPGVFSIFGDVIITGTTTNNMVIVSNNVNVTLSNANIDMSGNSAPAFEITGFSHANLILSGTNTLIGDLGYAGLYVPVGNSLIINGSGALTAAGGNNAAGIGSNGGSNINSGAITINSGTVNAYGGINGAGIGGGEREDGGSITINGGTVYAQGGDFAAGIGGGSWGGSGDIVISGGNITALGGDTGAGIGNGNGDAGTTNFPSFGTVTIYGNAIVSATGGSGGVANYAGGAGIGTGGSSFGMYQPVAPGVITITSGPTITATGSGTSPGDNIGYGGTFGNPPPTPYTPVTTLNYVSIDASAQTGGSISPSGNNIQVVEHTNAVFTVTTNQGFTLLDVAITTSTSPYYIYGGRTFVFTVPNVVSPALPPIEVLARFNSANFRFAYITSSLDTTACGENVTFTAEIVGANITASSGTVQFMSNGTPIGTPAPAVRIQSTLYATLTTSSLPLGCYDITASYSGDSFYPPITSTPISLSHIVKPSFSEPPIIYKEYGDADFYLSVCSGFSSVNGSYSFSSNNPNVARAYNNGRVEIVAPGEVSMTVKWTGTGSACNVPESDGVTIYVNPKPVTIDGITATKFYDGTNLFTNDNIDVSTGIINGMIGVQEVRISKDNFMRGYFGPETGTGTLTGIVGSITLTGAQAGNYVLSSQPTISATIRGANERVMTVTALGGSSNYGDNPENPGLTYSGMTESEADIALSGLSNSFNITNTTPPGIYQLTVEGPEGNYRITRLPGQWVVNKRPLTIQAISQTIQSGETPSALEYNIISGNLVNGDALTGELSVEPPFTQGTHPIKQGSLTAGDNYEITFIGGTITVSGDNNNGDDVPVEDDFITVEGLNTLRLGSNYYITAQCGDDNVAINVDSDNSTTVRIGGVQQNPRVVNLPTYGDNTFQIDVISSNGISTTYTLAIHKSVPVNLAYFDRFDTDILIIPVHLGLEGIGDVRSVEWFHNNVLLDRAPTKGYLEMKEIGAYYALLNGAVKTCIVYKTQNTTPLSMSVYPSPADASQEVTVDINRTNEELKGGQLLFHGINGNLLKTMPVTSNKMTVTIPAYSGVMVVKLILAHENNEVKLIVK